MVPAAWEMRFRTETKKGGFREPWEHTQSFPFGLGLGSHDLLTGEREDKPCLVLSNGERSGPLLAAQVGGCERFCTRHQRVKTDETRRDAVPWSLLSLAQRAAFPMHMTSG
jgi:hypothetical protein